MNFVNHLHETQNNWIYYMRKPDTIINRDRIIFVYLRKFNQGVLFFLFACQAKLKKGEDNGHGKSYNSWLAWWRSTITTDDFLKFLSTQVRDFKKSPWSFLFRSLRSLRSLSYCGKSTQVTAYFRSHYPLAMPWLLFCGLQLKWVTGLRPGSRPRTLFSLYRFFIHSVRRYTV